MGKFERGHRAPTHLLRGAATVALAVGLLPALSILGSSVPPAQAFTGGAG